MSSLRTGVRAQVLAPGLRRALDSRVSFQYVQTRSASRTVPRQNAMAATESPVSAPCAPLIDHQWLQSLVKRIPLVLDVKTPKTAEPDQYIQLPLGTHFHAPNREMGWHMAGAIGHALKQRGFAVIELGFDDTDSKFMLEAIERMGCIPDTHSSTQGALWDVTYKPSGVFSSKSGGTAHSRSHGVGEFAWHTDGSFEEAPQRYFGLHVVHPDEMGGGVLRVLPAEQIVESLKPESVQALLSTEFDILVPDEFYKGKVSNKGKLLDIDPETGRYLLRFRKDILPNPPSKSEAACRAVEELNNLLDNADTKGLRFGPDLFKKNVVILMDNARFLHMRTEIKDKRRLLRRVRFHDRDHHVSQAA